MWDTAHPVELYHAERITTAAEQEVGQVGQAVSGAEFVQAVDESGLV